MNSIKTSRIRSLKLCCGVSAILLIIVVVVLTTLSLTIFKPKQPQITTHPNLVFNSGSPSDQPLNVTIQMVITIDNPNYESFKYKNTTAYVTYSEAVVAEVPIVQEHVPAHAKLSVTTSADLMVSKLMLNPNFWNDVAAGCLKLNSEASLHGKVSLVKFLELHFKALSTCEILFFISSRKVESKCNTKFKL